MVHNEVACNKLRSASLVRYRRQHVLQLLQQFVQLTLVSADLLETLTRQLLAFGTSNHEPKKKNLDILDTNGWLGDGLCLGPGFPESGKQGPTLGHSVAPSIWNTTESSHRDPQYHCHGESAADRPKAALETPGRQAQLLGRQFAR